MPRAGLCDARQSSRYFRDFYARRALRIFPLYYGVLFVVHALIADFMLRHGTLASIGRFVPGVAGPFIVQVGLGVTLSMALAVLSYQYYEKRFLVLKERFRSGPSSRARR